MPRTARFTERVNLFVSHAAMTRLVATLRDGETVPAAIRTAIDRLLEERE